MSGRAVPPRRSTVGEACQYTTCHVLLDAALLMAVRKHSVIFNKSDTHIQNTKTIANTRTQNGPFYPTTLHTLRCLDWKTPGHDHMISHGASFKRFPGRSDRTPRPRVRLRRDGSLRFGGSRWALGGETQSSRLAAPSCWSFCLKLVGSRVDGTGTQNVFYMRVWGPYKPPFGGLNEGNVITACATSIILGGLWGSRRLT